MNENAKKIGIGVAVVLALGAAIYEGFRFVAGPPLNQARVIGHGTPGHGMRQRMNAFAGKGAAASTAPDESQLAGSKTP